MSSFLVVAMGFLRMTSAFTSTSFTWPYPTMCLNYVTCSFSLVIKFTIRLATLSWQKSSLTCWRCCFQAQQCHQCMPHSPQNSQLSDRSTFEMLPGNSLFQKASLCIDRIPLVLQKRIQYPLSHWCQWDLPISLLEIYLTYILSTANSINTVLFSWNQKRIWFCYHIHFAVAHT